MSMITLIAPIVTETLKFLNEKEKKSLYEEHYEIIEALRESKTYGDNNTQTSLLEEKLENFLSAYAVLLKDKNV